MTYRLDDEDGIIAIVNPQTYNGYISDDWELNELIGNFIQEMNEGNIIVWKISDYGNSWNIDVLDKPSDKEAFRELKKSIRVTSGRLYLIDYTALTMIAQFKDLSVESETSTGQEIKIENGVYDVTIRQMFSPDDYDEGYYDDDTDEVHFELIIEKSENSNIDTISKIYWW